MNFKNIHIGEMMRKEVAESGIEMSRICNFIKCTEDQVLEIFDSASLDTEILLKWSKLLEYDFFRIYTQHLILYAPQQAESEKIKKRKTSLPQFRKNIYTREIINFILELIETEEMSKEQVMERYRIPKTTLYKWINKYKS